MKRLLLISNSGRPYLGHCREEIGRFFEGRKAVYFVSAAPFIDPGEFFEKVRMVLEGLPFDVEHLDLTKDPLPQIEKADGLMVGGGNTYKLLQTLHQHELIQPIRKKVLDGMPFCGWSAGANIAGPTILTTNDWNVVGLAKFDALNLVPFNINPHYLETDPAKAPCSETRDDRIAEYHKANSNTVLGIEESTMLRVEGDEIRVIGKGRVRVFRPNQTPVDFRSGRIIESGVPRK